MFRKFALVLCAVLSMFLLVARAQPASEADAASFRQIISGQIAAFNADDGAKAWSYAAPSIKQIFPTPDIFMSMVKNGYQPVYRQQSFTFGEITEADGRTIQHVTIVDASGKVWTALYTMQKQPDGTWKISGCVLVQAPGVST
jgi:hypothetical protein